MRVVIIGGGLAGQSCAAFLQRLKSVSSIAIIEATTRRHYEEGKQLSIAAASNCKDDHALYTGLWSPALHELANIGFYQKIKSDVAFVGTSGYRSVQGNWLARPSVGLLQPFPSQGSMLNLDSIDVKEFALTE